MSDAISFAIASVRSRHHYPSPARGGSDEKVEVSAPGQPPYDCMSLEDLIGEREGVLLFLEHGPENEKEHRSAFTSLAA